MVMTMKYAYCGNCHKYTAHEKDRYARLTLWKCLICKRLKRNPCTNSECAQSATRTIAWPFQNGDIYVGGYCDFHAEELLAGMPGARRATGPAIRPELPESLPA